MADTMIDALLREREGYVARSLDERVAQVDEQLAFHGYAANEAAADSAAGSAETPDASEQATDDDAAVDDQPEPVEPKRTTVESKPRRRA